MDKNPYLELTELLYTNRWLAVMNFKAMLEGGNPINLEDVQENAAKIYAKYMPADLASELVLIIKSEQKVVEAMKPYGASMAQELKESLNAQFKLQKLSETSVAEFEKLFSASRLN